MSARRQSVQTSGTEENIAHLRQRALLSDATIVDGSLIIRDASSRNRNTEILIDRDLSYFVKRSSEERPLSLERERQTFAALSGFGQVAQLLPRVRDWSPAKGVLVFEHVGAMRAIRRIPPRTRYSRALAAAIGRALGGIHAVTADPTSDAPAALRPWALSLHRYWLNWIHDTSAASLELVRILQSSDDVCSLLDELAESWRPQAIIHSDFKWDNCVVVSPPGSRVQIKLVDWEAGGVGEPCWDIGSALGEYVGAWLSSIPITGEDPPERFPALAREPLGRMRPALAALWQAYVAARRFDPGSADRELPTAVRFAAVRLLQSGFEWSQHAAELSGNVVCMVQVASNMLKRPHEAAVRLLGLRFERAVP